MEAVEQCFRPRVRKPSKSSEELERAEADRPWRSWKMMRRWRVQGRNPRRMLAFGSSRRHDRYESPRSARDLPKENPSGREMRKRLRLWDRFLRAVRIERTEPEVKVEPEAAVATDELPEVKETVIGGNADCWRKAWFLLPTTVEESMRRVWFREADAGPSITVQEALARMRFHFRDDCLSTREEKMTQNVVCWTRHEGRMHIEWVAMRDEVDEDDIGEEFDGYTVEDAEDFEVTLMDAAEADTIGNLDAAKMVEASQAQNQGDIARQEANNVFNEELKSMPTVRLGLNAADKRLLQKRLGYSVRFVNSSPNYSGHVVIAAERELARASLERQYDHNTDVESALHIGATLHEWKKWQAHPGHDFLFNLKEDKDILRVSREMVALVGRRLKDAGLPSLTSVKGGNTRLENLTLDDCASILETCGRRRIFFRAEDISRQYNALFFEDCLYDITPAEVMEWVRKTGAKRVHAILFTPDFMVTEFAPTSDVYWHEQVLPAEEMVKERLEQVWPEVLLLLNFLPAGPLAQAFKDFIKWVLARGADVLKRFLERPLEHGTLIDRFFGEAFELMKVRPIIDSVIKKVSTFLLHELSETKVAWKSGAGNGYRHSTKNWRRWIHQRRFEDKFGFLDTEVREMHGEMWLIDMWVSTGSSSITYAVALPQHKATVRVLDVFSSYSVGAGFSLTPRFFSVLADDWYRIVNWALAEPLDSLDFGVMMTTVNRIRGGLKLGSNEIVAPMMLESDEVKSVALAALMEVSQLRTVSGAIEADAKLKKGYEANWKKLAAVALRCGLTIALAGLTVPVWFFVKWLLEEEKVQEWVQTPSKPKIVTVRGSKRVDTVKPELSGLSVVLPHAGPKTRNPCLTCQMYETGKFSLSGRPTDGQQFIAERHDLNGMRELVFYPDDITGIVARIREAIEEHTRLGAGEKLLTNMRKMKDWFETKMGSVVHHHVQCNLHEGGPGVGKSTCYRAMAKALESVGKNVVILSPFSKLLDDYSEKEVIGYTGLHTFKANTFWHTSKESNVHTMLVDEITNVDELLLAAMVLYTNTQCLYMAGDKLQTHLNTETGEGCDPLNEAHPHRFFDPEQMPKHTYVWNWRNRAGVVKMLNKRLGYSMRSKNSDYTMPLFLTREQYVAYKADNSVDREMVFAHATSEPMFGVQSQQNPKEENHSVRSEQGMTHKSVAVGVAQTDAAVIDAVGMRCVAVSRQKDDLIMVAHDWNDGVPAGMKEWMYCQSTEQWDTMCAGAWPEPVQEESKHELTADQEYLDRLIRKLNKERKVKIETPFPEDTGEDTAMTTMQLESARGFVDVMDPYAVMADEKPLAEFFNGIFADCFFSIVKREFGMEDEVYQYMQDTYFGPRIGLNKDNRTSVKQVKPMPRDANGKYVWYIEQIDEFCDKHDIALSLWSVGHDIIHRNKQWRERTETRRELNLVYDKSHITGTHDQLVLIHGDLRVNELEFFEGRRYFDVVERDARRGRAKGPWFDASLRRYVDLVGYQYLEPSGLDRASERRATEYVEMEGRMGLAKPTEFSLEKPPHIAQKLRTGTDAFKLAHWIDPSERLPWNNLSEPHVVDPITEDISATYVPEGLVGYTRTKAGRLKREPAKKSYSFTKGYANIYDGSTMETVSACQRLGTKAIKAPLNTETKQWARKVADKFVRDCMEPATPHDVQVYNKIVRDALADCKRRNYAGRADAERKKDAFVENRILVANKAQVKFKEPHNPMKPGQPLSMPNTEVQLKFVPLFRKLGYRFKQCAKSNVFIDDFESNASFAQRMTKAMAHLPGGSRFLIVDAEKFDSQQGPVTVYIEQCIHEALGADRQSLDDYYLIRQSGVQWSLLGRMKGKMTGNKPSGLPDTKLGNSLVEAALAHYKYDGLGDFVMAIKGDDYLRMQAGIHVNEQHAREIEAYTGLRLVEKLGDSGSFIGYAVSPEGLVPDCVKRAYKATAARSRDYKHFTEQQQAYRDLVDEVRALGGEAAAARGAVAVGANAELGEACWAFLNSVSHISKEQWEQNVRGRMGTVGVCPDVVGPRLV